LEPCEHRLFCTVVPSCFTFLVNHHCTCKQDLILSDGRATIRCDSHVPCDMPQPFGTSQSYGT
jgi:hypothetical protein